jgi:hypothetical protein
MLFRPISPESSALRDSYLQMAAGIDLNTERNRFQTTFQSIPIPQRSQTAELKISGAPTPADPVRDLIVEAQTAYNTMDNDGLKHSSKRFFANTTPTMVRRFTVWGSCRAVQRMSSSPSRISSARLKVIPRILR